jgi:hypothetical protein
MARPMPLAAPVITATFPSRSLTTLAPFAATDPMCFEEVYAAILGLKSEASPDGGGEC